MVRVFLQGMQVQTYTTIHETISCKVTHMESNEETVAGRIQSRLRELGKTPGGASTEVGSPSLIPNILNGRSQNPRIDTLERIAPVLQTSAGWLFDRSGPKVVKPNAPTAEPEQHGYMHAPEVELPPVRDMARDLPVYGTARGSLVDGVEGMDVYSTMKAIDYVRRPPALLGVPDAYAIWVSGDSMDPAHPHGALRMVHPHRPVSPGDTVIVQTRHYDQAPSQGYIKTYRRRNGSLLVLDQLNPQARIEIPVRYVVSVHKVLDLAELFGL